MFFFNKIIKKVISASCCFALLFAFTVRPFSAADEDFSVMLSDITVKCSSGANASATADGFDRVIADVEIAYPDAWVLLSFNIKNTGKNSVRLLNVLENSELPTGISLKYDEINDFVGKVIESGKEKSFSALIKADNEIGSESTVGTFALTLSFEAAYSSPDTGDVGIFPFAMTCAICAVLLTAISFAAKKVIRKESKGE